MHYLIIRLETEEIAKTLAHSIIGNYIWLNNYYIGNRADNYYNASNICEDTTKITCVITDR